MLFVGERVSFVSGGSVPNQKPSFIGRVVGYNPLRQQLQRKDGFTFIYHGLLIMDCNGMKTWNQFPELSLLDSVSKTSQNLKLVWIFTAAGVYYP